jgi:hypothetical protein
MEENEKQRATADLIDELRECARKASQTALVVGFEAHTEFVWNDDDKPLEKLNDLVEQGGEPVGMIGFTLEKGKGKFHVRPLAEYAGEDWVKDYLLALVSQFRALLPKKGVRLGPVKEIRPTYGWPN